MGSFARFVNLSFYKQQLGKVAFKSVYHIFFLDAPAYLLNL